jgi:hypothetical protein
MWDRRVEENIYDCEEFSVACSFRNVDNDFKWAFSGVYGPNVDNDRSEAFSALDPTNNNFQFLFF